MYKITQLMKEDHKNMDKVFSEFKKSKGNAKKLFLDFRKRLNEHISLEEGILDLFLEKKEKEGEHLASIIRAEHKEVRKLLDEMHEKISKKDSTDGLERKLSIVMLANEKSETGVIYPWVDQALNEKEKNKIIEKINARVS